MCSATATVSLTINQIAPVALDDAYGVAENGTLNVSAPGVLGNDSDPSSEPLHTSFIGDVTNGTLTLNADGSFSYTPTTGYYGSDSFTYQACNAEMCSATATVSITVNQIAPVALDDAYGVAENGTLNVGAPGVLGNDSDPSSEPLHTSFIGDVTNGALTLNADGSFSYTPTTGYYGSDSFTYQACNAEMCSATATVSLTVNQIAPVALDDAYGVAENGTLNVGAPGVLGNDSDPSSEPLHTSLIGDVTNGALTLNADGSFSYTPTTGYYGSDSFTYQACDAWLCSTAATVSITINPLPPVATGDSYGVHKNVTLNVAAGSGVLDNDTDPNGLALHAVLDSDVTHGSLTLNADGSFSYDPDTDYTGPDTFTYVACTPDPGSICSAPVTVSLTVSNDAPTALDNTYGVAENSILNVGAPGVLGNDSDPNGDSLTASLVSDVTNGSLTLNADGSFTYTPAAGYTGPDSFTYQACDAELCSATATVSLTVSQLPPVATADSYGVHKNVTLNVAAASGVLDNDTDPNGLALHAVLDSDVTHGTLTLNADGSFSYTPAAGYTGPDSFTYVACTPDPGSICSAPVTVSLTVGNDAPVALDDGYGVTENGTLAPSAPGVLGNDSDPNGDSPTAVLVSDVTNGALTLNADGSFSYTPTAGYTGPDSFTYQACDAEMCSATATVSITVVPADVPIAFDDLAFAVPGSAVTIQVLANDVAGSGSLDLASLQVTSGPSHGTATVQADGSITYLTAGGFASDSFVYRICNTVSSTCATATVYLTIDMAPVFGAGVDGSTVPIVVGGPLPDPVPASDPDAGDTLTITESGDLPLGLVLNGDGTWSGSTDGAVPGDYPITLQACDQHGLCTDVSITIGVAAPAGPTAAPTRRSTPPPTSGEAGGEQGGEPPILPLLLMLGGALMGAAYACTRVERRQRKIR
jgi:VCBS repeat-containing protein